MARSRRCPRQPRAEQHAAQLVTAPQTCHLPTGTQACPRGPQGGGVKTAGGAAVSSRRQRAQPCSRGMNVKTEVTQQSIQRAGPHRAGGRTAKPSGQTLLLGDATAGAADGQVSPVPSRTPLCSGASTPSPSGRPVGHTHEGRPEVLCHVTRLLFSAWILVTLENGGFGNRSNSRESVCRVCVSSPSPPRSRPLHAAIPMGRVLPPEPAPLHHPCTCPRRCSHGSRPALSPPARVGLHGPAHLPELGVSSCPLLTSSPRPSPVVSTLAANRYHLGMPGSPSPRTGRS